MNDVISMKCVIEKLKNIRQICPNEDENLYTFADFLINRLGDSELNPQGFYLTVQLSLTDLQRGVDGYSGKVILNNLVDLPPAVYSFLLIAFIENIVDKICPKEFSDRTKEIHQKILAEIKKDKD